MKLTQLLSACAAVAFAALLGVARPVQAAEQELNLFCWSEYVPEDVVKGFTASTGIKVNQENYASNEEMLSKLKSGSTKYDLVQPSEYTVELLVKQKALRPVNWAKVPNVKNLDPEYTRQGHDPEQKFTVPWMAGSVGIVVNTEKVKDPITGYKDVFQDKFKGRIVALNDNRELVSWAMDTMGLDVNNPTKENIEKVKPVLRQWIPLVKAWDSDSPKTALLQGDVDLGIVWSGEAALCYQQDPKFKFVLPKEGTHKFIDSLCIPADAAHPEAAELFMNYILQPEVSRMISDKFPYTNPNAEARKLLTKEQLANPASYPPGKPKMGIFHDIGAAAADIDQAVTEIKGG